jgi:hypothetical protein
MWPLRVGVASSVGRDDVYDWPSRTTKGVEQALHPGDRFHDKLHVPAALGIFSRAPSKATIGMNEVVLHIHDDQCRPAWVRSRHGDVHWRLPCPRAASVATIFQNQSRLKPAAPSRRSTMFTGDMSLDYLGGGRIGCNPARTGKGGAGCRSQTKFQ